MTVSADIQKKNAVCFSVDLWGSSAPVVGSICKAFVKGRTVAEWVNQ